MSGPFVELGENPSGHKHCVRQRIFGVLVCAAGEHKYKVRFENDAEQVCFSTSLRVESHDIGVPLEEVMPSLPIAQQEEAQGGVEDAEEEEENDFLNILTGVDDDALAAATVTAVAATVTAPPQPLLQPTLNLVHQQQRKQLCHPTMLKRMTRLLLRILV
jgi:hypothetical protein